MDFNAIKKKSPCNISNPEPFGTLNHLQHDKMRCFTFLLLEAEKIFDLILESEQEKYECRVCRGAHIQSAQSSAVNQFL